MSIETFYLIEKARAFVATNSFAASVVSQFDLRGSISARQHDALSSVVEKLAMQEQAKKVSPKTETQVFDVSNINKMFDTAVSNGLKKPRFTAEGLQISLAPSHGRNAGALYVKHKDSGEYFGKIVEGRYFPTSGAPLETADTLRTIAADPLAAAVKYGKSTGNCACCGRLLTAEGSVEAGVGPICADKWSL